LTVIVPRAAGVLDEVTGGLDTVGLRVPAHELALELLERAGVALPLPRRTDSER
jgi:L-threonylcarbamoyladenylate synthase